MTKIELVRCSLIHFAVETVVKTATGKLVTSSGASLFAIESVNAILSDCDNEMEPSVELPTMDSSLADIKPSYGQ